MKSLVVMAAGFGRSVLERGRLTSIAGLSTSTEKSVFPAVTCVAQASLRTGLDPAAHGVFSNGFWMDDLKKPLFWEQSAALVKGTRIWEARRQAGARVGLFFFQQSLGESADVIVSPAPIHKHGGGMMMSCYTKPSGLADVLARLLGRFPLHRYWGPFASPKVGRMCISYFEEMTQIHDVDEAYLYLPTLDYAAQKKGPTSRAAQAATREFVRQIERLAQIAESRGARLVVKGDYDITPVTKEPCQPNVLLRREGFFKTRTVGGRAYPDFYESTAFALCDHEFCLIYGEARAKAAERLLATGRYVRPATTLPNVEILLAEKESWCGYEWWTNPREAPDFASHVDIHNKPGYDPKELFLFCRGAVQGTHGRACEIATLSS